MKKIRNLYSAKATVLPARVMVLLSKYSQAVKEHEGVVIQLSSLNVFKHVHASYARSRHPAVHKSYKMLLNEVNLHLSEGNMVSESHDNDVSADSRPAATEFDDRYRNPEFWKSQSRSSV
ncbi:hypothetical protein NBRC116583_13340 [Arenicella sp. 4NH20-0111]|uniref:hypothetical protein n=1 Tax=Arenicella sp. 4NH20-0111 TaxID=3127648 RepID=UPI00310B0C3F